MTIKLEHGWKCQCSPGVRIGGGCRYCNPENAMRETEKDMDYLRGDMERTQSNADDTHDELEGLKNACKKLLNALDSEDNDEVTEGREAVEYCLNG